MVRVVDCSFQRFSCGHELFNATYTRSNRTKGTKIMRCFPHCCPEHMPRCYCGCSLHVLVTLDDLRAVDLDELVVCARFETSEQQEPRHAPPLGAPLAIPRVLLSRNADDANATTWIVAERESEVKQREVAKNSVLFVMNNHRFPRWYYGYESGATKNQRDMRHHLTAYVLQRTRHPAPSADQQLTRVLGRLPSPAFKLVSYRRARGEVKKPVVPMQDDPLAGLEDQGWSSEEDGCALSDTVHSTPTKGLPPSGRDKAGLSSGTESPASVRSIETRVPDAPVPSLAKELARQRANSSPFVMVKEPKPPHTRASFSESESQQRCTPEPPPTVKTDPAGRTEDDGKEAAWSRKRKAVSSAAKHLWWRQHADDAQRVLHLHVLFVMLNRLTLHDVMFCVERKSDRLRSKWFTVITEAVATSEASVKRLAGIARGFCLSAFAEPAAKPAEGVAFTHSESRDVVGVCVEVLLEVGTSEAVQRLLQATWDTHQTSVLQSGEIRELFVQFVRRLHGAIDTTLRNRRRDAAPPASGRSHANASGQRPANASQPQQHAPGSGVAALVDDAMAAVFREERLLPLRRDMVHALSDSSRAAERWYQVFVAQLRVAWVQFHERKASGINLLWQAALTSRQPIWRGRWILDASSYRVRRPGGWFHRQPNEQPVSSLGSVVSWIVLLRQWFAIELAMDGKALTISSLLTGSKRASMQLLLDERQRVFKSFPDGMASMIGLGGGDCGAWLHGDYVGRGSDDANEILCETYSIRQRANQHTEALRLSIKASLWDPTAASRRCILAVQLATASCGRFAAEQIVTWPVTARHEQLYARANWCVVADVEAAYLDLH